MKNDRFIVSVFILLVALLMLGIMPRHYIENSITGHAVSDLSLASFSNIDIVTLIVIIAVVIVISLLLLFRSRSSKFKKIVSESPSKQPRPVQHSNPHHQKLHAYVQNSRAKGKSHSEIRDSLRSVGWPSHMIDKVIKK